jgi:hypothetical protein
MILPEEYRYHHIRGRSQREMDSLLPIFARFARDTCPVAESEVKNGLLSLIEKFFPTKTDKTRNNFATEIIRRLLGMIVVDAKGEARVSDLALKLLEDDDQPAFFKVLVSRIQLPNPMSKESSYRQELDDAIHVRPAVLVLEVLRELDGPAGYLELRTFALASKVALQGAMEASQIADAIREARATKAVLPNPSIFEGKPNRARYHQHIDEMLKLLELANLVRRGADNSFTLNIGEQSALDWIFQSPSNKDLFRHMGTGETYSEFQNAWSEWYGSLPSGNGMTEVETPIAALIGEFAPITGSTATNTTELGKIGEQIVLNWQVGHVKQKRPQDIRHVKDRSMERGIGYDIQSVWCEGEAVGQFRYLEVKTTKRSTKPDPKSESLDLVTFTANEYRAAVTHGRNFCLCRVYLFQDGYEIHALDDPIQLAEADAIIMEPSSWNLYLTDKAISEPDYEGSTNA